MSTPIAGKKQADYWNKVAEHIRDSSADHKDLVGYHSPYDVYVRERAVELLDRYSNNITPMETVAELGSGAGLNLRYFSGKHPRRLIAFDCSPELLGLAKQNLSDLDNVTYVQTNGYGLPVPDGAKIDVLFTLTVLQHITDAAMFEGISASMKSSGARYILIIEDTRRTPKENIGYVLRTPEHYLKTFDAGQYQLVSTSYVSLSWAALMFGCINRMGGLYKRHEGSRLPDAVFSFCRVLYPLARMLDRFLPGRFGMTVALFELKHP